MKRFFAILSAFMAFVPLSRAQNLDSLNLTDAYLDTVNVRKVKIINDYTTVGVNYGVSFSRMSFNPAMEQSWLFQPQYMSFTYTRYGKMFGYMPYFGMQLGLSYGHEGYLFKENEKTGRTYDIEGATQAVYDVLEVPFLAMIHVDATHFRFMAKAGIYGGYRMGIERTGNAVLPELAASFKDTDHRFDFGLQGGGGFALLFDPVEIHFNALLRYSWSTIYDPDIRSEYYYRFAYPFDLMITAGVHFQLTKRRGKTTHQLRREAYETVFGKHEDKVSEDR